LRSLDRKVVEGSVDGSSLELTRLAVLRAASTLAYLAASYATVRPTKASDLAAAEGCGAQGCTRKEGADCRRHFECNDPLLRCFEIAERARILQRTNREFRKGRSANLE